MTTEAVDPRREVILTEIRRVAQTMGGAAPGRQVFERETGIRQGEWLGIYWARWGDALVAAGLSSNRKNAKLDGATFLARIAQVFRHHRRVPTTGEFRLYRQVDPICPAHSTLDNRFSFPAPGLARWPTGPGMALAFECPGFVTGKGGSSRSGGWWRAHDGIEVMYRLPDRPVEPGRSGRGRRQHLLRRDGLVQQIGQRQGFDQHQVGPEHLGKDLADAAGGLVRAVVAALISPA